jgi:hypothetical protein
MGAALTYARRYALFALVGIAGEDDLDAPDLNAPTPTGVSKEKPRSFNGGDRGVGKYWGQKKILANQEAKEDVNSTNARLKGQLSAVLRDQLMSELKDINSAEDAALWARRILPAKNSLNVADARQIEEAFQDRLVAMQVASGEPERSSPTVMTARNAEQAQGSMRKPRPASIDKSHLPYPEPRRIRDRDHVRFVTKQPCLICGRRPADPHHLRFTQQRALGRKVSDEFTVPLCRGHHREAHRFGDEATWWKNAGVDPTIAARALWRATHPLPKRADTISSKSETSLTSAPTEQNGQSDPALGERDSDDETKPIFPDATQ